MKDCRKFYIDGRWVEAVQANPCDVINPADEKVVGVITLGTAADVDASVAAASRAFPNFSETTVDQRLDLLRGVLDVYKKRSGDLAEAISLEMGAPLWLASTGQVGTGMAHLQKMIAALPDFVFETQQGSTLMRKEPIGVCGLITPWNWPINQIACKVVPGLAAGCTMVLKPSEIAPLSAWVWTEILHEAGVPAGVFNMINGDGPTVGQAIASHPGIDMVSFTGSTRAGVAVAQAAAPTIKRVMQELGGKSANILLDDVDLDRAVSGGVRTCFSNSGQSCNAPSRMLVPQPRYEEAVEIAGRTAEKTNVGAPDGAKGCLGPVVSQVQYDKIQGLIRTAIQEGARVVAGGPGHPQGYEGGYYVRPTVLADITNDMTIAREEIFGPVIALLAYEDEDDAVRIANDTLYGLSGYVSSANVDRARRVGKRIRAGNIHINGSGADFAGSFGGYKQSGNGREWGTAGLEEYLELKSLYGYEAASQ